MATRTNHNIVPSCKVDQTFWFGPGTWTRSAALHASLPRQTGLAGTSTGNVQPGRATGVFGGKYVVWSVSMRAISPQTVRANIDWYAGAVFVSPSTSSSDQSLGGNSTGRLVSGVGLAPAGTTRIQPNVTGVDGSAQLAACLIEVFDTEAEAIAAQAQHADPAYYFDGDTAGAAWSGADGESPSVLTFDEPVELRAVLPRPTAQLVAQRTVHPVLTAQLSPPQAAIGLLVSASYDERRGRVRIEASGFSSTVIRAVVSSRVAGRSRWSPVRGGKVAVISGGMVRTVDDYEFRSGSLVEYRIEGYATQEGEPAVIVQQRLVRVGPTERQVWIKFIASPYLNTRVELTDWSAVSRRARIALYDVSNRRDRVAVTDVHTGREFSIEVVVHTLAARDTLDEALGKGAPIFLQTPDTIACPTMYAAVGDFQWARPAPRSLRSLVTIQLYEVAPPPPSVVGTGMTYAVLAEQYGAYGDIGDTHDTYGDVAS